MAKTHKRVLSLILSLVMVLSLLPIQALAADPRAGSSQVSAEADGVVVNKEVTYDSNGYQLSLESYVTNEVTKTETTTPLDIVLVLDVSGSMEDNFGKETYYTAKTKDFDGFDLDDGNYYYLRDGEYYQVKVGGNMGKRYAYYTYNGNEIRLSSNSGYMWDTLYSGTLYLKETKNIDRLAALQTAVNGFIDQVAANAADSSTDVTHRISIVKFADDSKANSIGDDFTSGYNYNYTQIVKDLTDVSGSGATTLKNAVTALSAAGATSVDYGLDLAENVLDGSGHGAGVGAREDAKQVVIVFTDGEPNHSNGFSNSVAAAAVNKAKTLKDNKVTVFTVGVFSSANPEDTTDNKFNKYMHGVSSNYPNATATDQWGSVDWDSLNLGDRAQDSNYYLAATNADDLNSVFSSIADSISTSKVKATGTTVLTDTLSEYFAFPEGFSGDRDQITVTKVPVDPKTGGWDVDKAENITNEVSVTVDGKNIQVIGFDYTENAVTKTTAADDTVTWSGAKLVLTFPIVPDKTATWGESGNYATNSVAAGSQAGLTGYTVDDKPGSLTLDNSTGTGEDGSPIAPVNTYQVTYSWSGLPGEGTKLYNADGNEVTAPVLPTDSGYYISGQTYTVDDTYTRGTVLYTHDDYGNVNGKYTFSGWTDPNKGTMVEGGVTISGEWTKTDIQVEQATITFVVEKGGENAGTTADSGAINRTFPNRPDATATTGYTFDGWYDAAGNEVTTWPEKVTADATYTAKFSRNQFTVTWKNGEETLETDEGVLYGTAPSYDEAEPTKASTDSTVYTFVGWSTNPHATAAEAIAEGDLPAVTDDVTYYAIFSESTRQYDITVNYVSDDGKPLQGAYTTTAGYDSYYDVTAQIPASIQFEGTNYAKDTVTGAISGKVQGNVEITVIYSVDEIGVEDPDQPDTVPDKYQKKVTFDVANGAWNDETETQKEAVVTLFGSDGETWDKNGTGYLTAEQIPAVGEKPDTGYKEGSWEITPTTDLAITADRSFTYTYAPADDTMYKVEHYKQNLDGTGYELAETEDKYGTTGTTATAVDKDYPGFTYDSTVLGTVTSGTIAADGSLVLKLYYTRNSYEVKYEYTGTVPANAPDVPVAMLYKYGAEVTVMPAPAVQGYTFSGWNTEDAEISGDTFTMPANPVTFTGSFSQDGYTVIYDLNGGAVAEGTELTYTGLAFLSATPTISNPYKEGFDFIGWDPEWSSVVTGSVTYVAQYEEIGDEYDVIYKVDGQEVMRFTYTEGQKVFVEMPWTGASEWTTTDVTVRNDLFTMPAHNVVFTATTEPQTATTYQVITHYVARDGSEGTVSDSAQNGEIGALVSGLYSASEKTTYQGQQYLLDKVTFNGVAVNNTETLAEGANVIDIYYDIDAIGENPDNPDSPDDVPDKNQVIFTYESNGNDPTMGTVSLSKVVVTKVNGLATAPQATATPSTGYAFVKWTESSYGMESTYADMSGLPLQHDKDTWFVAIFTADGGQVDPEPYPNIPVYFMAVNGSFPGGDYTVMVSADENGSYYLSAEDIQTAVAYTGFGPDASWTCNNVACAAPAAGTVVQSGDLFVVTFAAAAQPESYTVTYQWSGNAPAGVTPPTADTVPAGAPYGIKNPSDISWEDEDGYWTFLGWTDGNGTAYMGNVTLTGSLNLYGTWDFQAKPEVDPQPPQTERFFVTKNAVETVVTAGDTIHWIITVGNLTDEDINLTVTDSLAGAVVTDETGAVVTTVTVPAQNHVILNASYVTTDADANKSIYNTVVVADADDPTEPPAEDTSTGTKVEPQYFSVTWQNYDGTVLELDPKVEKGTMPVYNGSTPTRPGDMYYVYTFTGWTPTVSPVTGDAVYTATYQATYVPPYIPPVDPGTDIDDEDVPLADLPGLNTVDHYAYIAGYEDGTVRPNNNITRAEVATIFFRLFTDEYRQTYWATSNSFSDVAAGDWYNNGVSTTANAGIVAGYPDGTFLPNNNITRAEFATIAARFLSDTYVGPDLFTDIDGHWAAEYINRAANAGWINGYPDGSFRPDAYITRAEAMTLVNNMLGRAPHRDHMLADMIRWPDNPETAWFYEAVQEATNGHDYDWVVEEDVKLYEIWLALQENRDWAALETEWANAYSAPGGEVIG